MSVLFPAPLLGFFLAPDDPDRIVIIATGVALLGMAALFQVVDGAQIMALGLLRGVKDSRAPMLIATLSYWGVGAPCAYVFGFVLGWEGPGVWFGLVMGLSLAAVLLMLRFLQNDGWPEGFKLA